MNRWTETVTVNVANAPELRAVVRRRGEFYRWVSNVGNGSLKKTRDSDLDIRENAGVVRTGVIPPIWKDCRPCEIRLEPGTGQTTHKSLKCVALHCVVLVSTKDRKPNC